MSSIPATQSVTFGDAAASRGAVRSLTLQNYLRTVAWTLAAVGVCAAGYAVEKYAVIGWLAWLPNDTAVRMFKNPSELPMRLFGLPHFIVGTMFLLSSRRLRGAGSVALLMGLALVGGAICYGFYRAGAQSEPLAMLLFYFYFLIHGFRDEAFFYKSYGDMPADAAATHPRVMNVLQIVFLGLLMALIIPAYSIYGVNHPRYRSGALEAIFPADFPFVQRFMVVLGPVLVVAGALLYRIGRAFPDGLSGLWRVHRPILTIFAISSGIILLSLTSGPWSFNIVVLMHFVGWYIFGKHQLTRFAPREPVQGWWNRIRRTPAGFSAFHIGLAVVFFVLVALNHYAFGKAGWIEDAFGSKTFFYWTIMHVTLSFFPR